MSLPQIQLGGKKLYFSLLIVLLIFLLPLIWYYREMHKNSGQGRLLETPPLWYQVHSPTAFGATGAITGFAVDLHRFREYIGDLTLREWGEPDASDVRTEKCRGVKKWAVITTIAPAPTLTMTVILEKSPEYCLVVVGDRKSPTVYKMPEQNSDRFVYLSLETQLALPLEIISLTPENTFNRKNIGYMYAIANGAEIILDIDDDNVPILLNGKYIPLEEEMNTFDSPIVDVETEGHVWNPYPYYGALTAWPRGYPLDRINPLDRKLKTTTVRCLPVIQQFMANRDPDVDAIWRLAHKLPRDFISEGKKSLVIPHGVFVPYNAQATVHLHQAFWSLLLPMTVNGRVADIWRSYISQYLLNYTPDVCLMFAPPAVRHERNSHNYMQDFTSEIPLYVIASKLVEMLATEPPKNDPYEVVFRDLYVKLYETGVLEEGDVRYAIAWLNDLKKVGYKFPQLNSK